MQRIVVLLLLMFYSLSASSEVYKWRDENGQLHYGSKPPAQEAFKELKISKPKIDAQAVQRLNQMTSSGKSYNRAAGKSTKRESYNSSKTSESTAQQDKRRCKEYKERYERYKREGIMGINTATGKISKMKGEDEKRGLENAKMAMDVFCN